MLIVNNLIFPMKKILAFSLLIFLIGCEAPHIDNDLTIETPELPNGIEEIADSSPEETYEVELIFKTKNSPFAEIVDLDPQCLEESYLEENSEYIVQALVTETGEEYHLNVVEWLKGDPSTLSAEITFNNTVSTSPSFASNMEYKIYFSEVNGKFVTTCYQEGIHLNHPYGDDGLEN